MLRKLFIGFLTLILIGLLTLSLFMIFSPQFGKAPDPLEMQAKAKASHYEGKTFKNTHPKPDPSFFRAILEVPKMFNKAGNPKQSLPTNYAIWDYSKMDTSMHLRWFGHSSFEIKTAGKHILIDPMFTQYASPFPFGSPRFPNTQPIPWDQFSNIDILLISHDHYDHLDYETIKKLAPEVGSFVVPLGVGSHLERWGIQKNRIHELDWWENLTIDEITLTATPAHHFSGRSLTDRDATLWSGWSIQTSHEHLYFSGDGGYDTHFKEIADKLPKIDLALVECGQYNPVWKHAHMMPEESVQAAIDLNATVAMPIHWGAFRLAPHAWDDPILRFTQEAEQKNITYITPSIGEVFTLKHTPNQNIWW